MPHLALVPKGDPVEIEPPEPSNRNDSLCRIYEHYAALYPNPRLVEEARERERLGRAIDAAQSVQQQSNDSSGGGGMWSLVGKLWGRTEPETPSIPDDQLVFISDDDDTDGPLCGTSSSLDTSCIPPEAHSLAQFHMISRKRQYSMLGDVWVEGRGTLFESGISHSTTDREFLPPSIDVSYVRGTKVGDNLLFVSWGLLDGMVVGYRRTTDGNWDSFALLRPSEAVRQNVEEIFMEEQGSALALVTDVVALSNEEHGTVLAVARLGGYMELVPLPHAMLSMPPMEPRKRKKRRKGQYWVGDEEDLAAYGVVALTTVEYHENIMGLAVFATEPSEWEQALYPDSPPGNFVLAAFGQRDDQSSVSFWSVATKESHPAPLVHAHVTEAIDLGRMGQDMTFFVSSAIMKYWRHPRRVEIRDSNAAITGSDDDSVVPPIKTITFSAPVASLRFHRAQNTVFMSVVDLNGGVAVMECGLLDRTASNSLSPDEYDQVIRNPDPDFVLPLVNPIIARRRIPLEAGGEPLDVVAVEFSESNAPNELVLVVRSTDVHAVSFLFLYNLDNTPAVRMKQVPIDGSIVAFARSEVPSLVVSTGTTATSFEWLLPSENEGEVLARINAHKRRAWECFRDFGALESLHDVDFLVNAALKFDCSSPDETWTSVEAFRRVHAAALKAIPADHASYDELCERFLTAGTLDTLHRMKTGTGVDIAQLARFLDSETIEGLASDCATAGDLSALSLVAFRHLSGPQVLEALNHLSAGINLVDITHLLVLEKEGTPYIPLLSSNQDWQTHAYSGLDELVADLFDSPIVDDAERIFARWTVDRVASSVSDIARWLRLRLEKVRVFSGSLQGIVEVLELAMFLLEDSSCPDLEFEERSKQLCQVDCIMTIALRQTRIGSSRGITTLSGLDPLRLETIALPSVLQLLCISRSEDPQVHLYLLALLDSWAPSDILKGCVDYLGSCTMVEDAYSSENVLVETVGTCVDVILKSTERDNSITRTMAGDLLEVYDCIRGGALSSSLTSSDHLRGLLKELWRLYEAIPATNATLSQVVRERADAMYDQLVCADLVEGWFSSSSSTSVSTFQDVLTIDSVFAVAGHSFAKQAMSLDLAQSQKNLLLRYLASDIGEVVKLRSYDQKRGEDLFFRHLLEPLLQLGASEWVHEVRRSLPPDSFNWDVLRIRVEDRVSTDDSWLHGTDFDEVQPSGQADAFRLIHRLFPSVQAKADAIVEEHAFDTIHNLLLGEGREIELDTPPSREDLHQLAEALGSSSQEMLSAIDVAFLHALIRRELVDDATSLCTDLIAEYSEGMLPSELGKRVAELIELATSSVDFGKGLGFELLRSASLHRLTDEFAKVLDIMGSGAMLNTLRTNRENTTPIERLTVDTLTEYSVDVGQLVSELRFKCKNENVDDSLLNTLCRYAMYWCIAKSTVSQMKEPQAAVLSTALLSVAILVHMDCTDTKTATIDELREILETQRSNGHVVTMPMTTADPSLVTRLVEMGYTKNGSRRACIATGNRGLNEALQWTVTHSTDHDFDSPIVVLRNGTSSFSDTESASLLEQLLATCKTFVASQVLPLDSRLRLLGLAHTSEGSTHLTSNRTVVDDGTVSDKVQSSQPSSTAPDYATQPSCEGVSSPKQAPTMTRTNCVDVQAGTAVVERTLSPGPENDGPKVLSAAVADVATTTAPFSQIDQTVAGMTANDKRIVDAPPRLPPPVKKPTPPPAMAKPCNGKVTVRPRTVTPTVHASSTGSTVDRPTHVSRAAPSSSKTDDERRRLIEEGRRLLMRSRASNQSSPTTSVPASHRYNLRSRKPPAEVPSSTPSKGSDGGDNGWDFDDELDV